MPGTSTQAPGAASDKAGPPTLRALLLTSSYVRLLVLCLLVGVPVALAAFFFVSLQHVLQHWVWHTLPEDLGYGRAPWWWPLPALLLAGLILAPVVTRLPGKGGHLPVLGIGGAPLGPSALPGVALAALATLPLGVVLGPEAPLMALGSGLALLAIRSAKRAAEPQRALILATAGSTTAISTILGGPVVAVLLVIEAAGLGGPQLVALVLPCLIASGVGGLVFTGFGSWTGLSTGALRLPEVPPDTAPDAADFLWGIPMAVLVALIVTVGRRLGRLTAGWTGRQTAVRTVLCALAVGVCISAYALITGRSPEEAALSGQATIADLAAHPHAWPVGALVALVACKGLAWGISLGALRGGPIFPALMLGSAVGIACSGLPGFGATAGFTIGTATATAAVTGLPVSSAVLAVLLMGSDAHSQMPLIVVGVVVAVIVRELAARPAAAPQPPIGR
ncbi:chloride channel protein [Streptomyces sp. NPDC006208]|uniref:chloride channel protein n=1 Tax=Streptomyces sp. NPDC006208 TaxID=3156734 RepID=UPI00339F46CD